MRTILFQYHDLCNRTHRLVMYISLQMKCFVLRGGFIMCRQPMISPCMHGIKRAFYGRVRGVEGGGGVGGNIPISPSGKRIRACSSGNPTWSILCLVWRHLTEVAAEKKAMESQKFPRGLCRRCPTEFRVACSTCLLALCSMMLFSTCCSQVRRW